MHCVFSTEERRKLITPELQERLYPYLGGIARENKIKALSIGGVEDHVHALLSIPSTLSIAKTVQLLKGNSSKWIHQTFSNQRLFEWQEGYGAFSIAVSGVKDTMRYIETHRCRIFGNKRGIYREKVLPIHDPGDCGVSVWR
jgi:REP element-mobilizing transposase RayT